MSFIGEFREGLRKRAAYRKTVSEIEQMPADVARDLNIDRGQARALARKAVYGY
jgi:uncharacterized protein YjiS (DUF1127 family)